MNAITRRRFLRESKTATAATMLAPFLRHASTKSRSQLPVLGSVVHTHVAFATNGDFYVGDGYGSHHLLRFSSDGKFLGEVGRPGHGDGEFDTPHGLFVDTRGGDAILVVADRGNRRVQTFSLDGSHLRTIKDDSRLCMPCHFHTQGEWMVCPDLDSQVCILDREYNVVTQLGDGRASNGEVGS